MPDKLIWSRLKDMKCPRCSKNVELHAIGEFAIRCTNKNKEKCDFKMRKDTFDRVINQIYSPKPVQKDLDTIQLLNNL